MLGLVELIRCLVGQVVGEGLTAFLTEGEKLVVLDRTFVAEGLGKRGGAELVFAAGQHQPLGGFHRLLFHRLERVVSDLAAGGVEVVVALLHRGQRAAGGGLVLQHTAASGGDTRWCLITHPILRTCQITLHPLDHAARLVGVFIALGLAKAEGPRAVGGRLAGVGLGAGDVGDVLLDVEFAMELSDTRLLVLDASLGHEISGILLVDNFLMEIDFSFEDTDLFRLLDRLQESFCVCDFLSRSLSLWFARRIGGSLDGFEIIPATLQLLAFVREDPRHRIIGSVGGEVAEGFADQLGLHQHIGEVAVHLTDGGDAEGGVHGVVELGGGGVETLDAAGDGLDLGVDRFDGFLFVGERLGAAVSGGTGELVFLGFEPREFFT